LADASAEAMSDDARVHERDSALLVAAVRDAGALALSLFRTELKNWTKGASSPVSEADIAVNDLIERQLRTATPAQIDTYLNTNVTTLAQARVVLRILILAMRYVVLKSTT